MHGDYPRWPPTGPPAGLRWEFGSGCEKALRTSRVHMATDMAVLLRGREAEEAG